MALHEGPGRSDEWYTPPRIFDAMKVTFDQDVASPGQPLTPWVPASEFVTHGALERQWSGFIWMNPPFGRRMGLVPWLMRFFEHGDGVALVPDRTSCPWWQDFAPRACLTLAVREKIHFIPGPGVQASSPAQGTTLLAAGMGGVRALQNAAEAGLGSLWLPMWSAR